MKILIIGASGVLGARLYNDSIKNKWNTMGTFFSHEHEGLFYLDVRDKRKTEKLFNFFDPEVVVLSGGATDVDFCEKKPSISEDVNIKGTLNIAKRVKERNAKLIYLSTDYVFSGENGPYTEEDKTSPINRYGRTKLEAEEIVKGMIRNYAIVRTSQIYGLDINQRNFSVKIISNIKSNKKVFAADDFYSTPTYVGNLSDAVIKLIEKETQGLFHVGGKDFIDRFFYVSKIGDIFNLDKNCITKVKLNDLNLKAKRPQKGGLKSEKIKEEFNFEIVGIEKGLKLFKEDLKEL